MELFTILGLGGVSLLAVAGAATFVAFVLRRVVPTNEVHIVQSAKKTTSYGKGTGSGNTYYEWPSFLPLIGVTKVKYPVSNFSVKLENYEAFDKGRLPFVVDIAAFFCISDSAMAAQKVSNFEELKGQLNVIVQGAIRSILAKNDIENILEGRGTFGDQFTIEVSSQLANWGVSTVKNIELMDIRDSSGSQVIANIMAKKKSLIESESRIEVAKNKRTAQMAEIEAQREVDLQKAQAAQAVGMRTVESEREVELAQQSKLQTVKEQERLTKEKEMNVLQIQHVRSAEINKEVEIVKAKQSREASVIAAEASKTTTVLAAEAKLEAQRRSAEGMLAEGNAKAGAEKALQLAPVEAQIVLAKEIGENQSYQNYLIKLREVDAQQAVGIAQATALNNADIKVIANTGNVGNGLESVMDIFSSKGGTQVGAMLEGLAATDKGQEIINKITGAKPAPATSLNGVKH